MSLQNFAAFAVVRTGNTNGVVIKDLTIEEAREHVRVVDGNTKKPIDGKQGLTLKLGRVKVALNAVFPKADKLEVPDDQVEAATTALMDAVANGDFDKGIDDALIKLNTSAEPKSATPDEPNEEDFEDLPEDDELSAEDE